jgi:hypothetical protein
LGSGALLLAAVGAAAAQVIPPVKEADFKLTLSTNREAVQVMELFADMVAQVCERPECCWSLRDRQGSQTHRLRITSALSKPSSNKQQVTHTCPRASSHSASLQANPAYAEALARSQAANMLSFRYPGGQTASILVSKNGGRYRLQGSCLEAMWLVLQV